MFLWAVLPVLGAKIDKTVLLSFLFLPLLFSLPDNAYKCPVRFALLST